MRLLEIEEPSVEDCAGGHVGLVGLNDLGIRVQAADDLARGIGALGSRIGNLVQHHDIGESIWSVSRCTS